MLYVLILFPLVMAAIAFAISSNRWRPWLLPIGGAGQLMLVLTAIAPTSNLAASLSVDETPLTELWGWLNLDALGTLVLLFISVLFFLCALYAPAYLTLRHDRDNRVLCANLLAALSMMTLVTLAHHLGVMWVAMEMTTLVTAPFIYFNRNARSLEATWKYLLIGSVGIALALMGSFFLAYAEIVNADSAQQETTLLFDDLIENAGQLDPNWLDAAFVLLFIGYGTKMGLAPMHTWKPDAYGEAPGIVGAILAGGLTSCAFLAVLRIYQICANSDEGPFVREIMIFAGLFSMGVAAAFMVRQRDFKRMLAYSSVEHMGILVLGIGIGGKLGTYGALLHLINNGLTKGVLFLSAGNIRRAYHSKLTDHVRGAIERVPWSGWLFLGGFLAITGSPPFGPFVSEFTILNAAVSDGHFATAGIFLLLLIIVFMGMGATVLAIVQGRAPEESATGQAVYRDSIGTVLPIVIFMGLVLLLGLYIPPPLDALLQKAATSLGGSR